MVGIQSGKAWSRIGKTDAPTIFGAQGVWTVEEEARQKGAGTWPAPYEAGYNFFGTVSANSGQVLTVTNIPQNGQDLMILMYTTTAGNSTNVSFIPNGTSIGSTAAPGGYMFNNNTYTVGRKTNATTNATAIYNTGYNNIITVYNYSSTTAAKGLFYQGGQAASANNNAFQEWGYANYATLGSAAVTSFSIVHTGAAMSYGSFATVFGIGAS